MITALLNRLRDYGRGVGNNASPGKVDLALNQTYLQLHRAQRDRSFIEVMVAGNEVVYQSMILELDPEERTVLIDELFPVGFTGLAGQKVKLSIRLQQGRKIKFDSVITESYLHNDAPLYVLAMPKDIETDQRRSAYRLPIRNVAIDSHFIGPDQQPYCGRLRNVSSTGISLEIETASAANDLAFHYNDRFDHLVFDFAGINVDCGVTVRSVEVDPADDHKLVIGAEFLDLPVQEQRILERSIMRVQRERVKYSAEVESQLIVA
ncbi:flagellar brake protein [Oceanicoccus sp. KOV_DT_Chl]|uniref:flagellar brake protein n=1 Tax=Oceanicoccus sp. KOV_DT_Chl TaxID=1904639 RepID=UPI000C79FB09|nr:PilZ domain-containing protein [Oceanicoccus sp. KOV_DT_Chl]